MMRYMAFFLPPVLLAAGADAFAQSSLRVEPAFPNLSFNRPVDLQHAGDGSGRLFVVEQAGTVRVFEKRADVSQAAVFPDVRDRVNSAGNEEGLLGLAFHPDYENSGRSSCITRLRHRADR